MQIVFNQNLIQKLSEFGKLEILKNQFIDFPGRKNFGILCEDSVYYEILRFHLYDNFTFTFSPHISGNVIVGIKKNDPKYSGIIMDIQDFNYDYQINNRGGQQQQAFALINYINSKNISAGFVVRKLIYTHSPEIQNIVNSLDLTVEVLAK